MTSGEGQARIRVRVSREHGTVDFLAEEALEKGVEFGAFSRAMSCGKGSEFMFTVMLGDDAEPSAVERQREIVEHELARVRTICESAA